MARKAAKKSTTKKSAPKKIAKKKAAAPAKERKQRMAAHAINKEDRALFLNHLNLIAPAVAKITQATNTLRKLYKTAKADGFLSKDFQLALALQKEGGIEAYLVGLKREATVGAYLGVEQMEQALDLFAHAGVEEQTPEQRAFDYGKQHALENKKPDATGFDEQHYLRGYHSVSEKRVKEGIKPTEEAPKRGRGRPRKEPSADVKAAADRAEARASKKGPHPEVAADETAKAAQAKKAEEQRNRDAAEFDQPVSGTPMTRSQFNAQQGASGVTTKPEPAPGASGTGGGGNGTSDMFQRREPALTH